VTEAPARELGPTFADCERGESWPAGARPWWKFVGPKEVGQYCKKIVRKRDAAAFLIYGIVNAFDIEVFAREKRLAQLWNVSRRKGKPPAFVEEAPNLHVRFGKPKNMHKVTLRECLRYPIWVFTGHEEEEYDEEHETPVISSKNVSASLLENYEPHITVRVKDANFYGSGYYDHGQRELNNICVWRGNRWVGLEEAKLNGPLTFVAVPSILGKKSVAFRCDDPESGTAAPAASFNHALQRTRPSRPGCNPTPSWAGSLSLGLGGRTRNGQTHFLFTNDLRNFDIFRFRTAFNESRFTQKHRNKTDRKNENSTIRHWSDGA